MNTTPIASAGGLPLSDLELSVDGVRIVSVAFAISLYTDRLFSSIPDAVLKWQEAFLRLCPAERLKFYATENMKKHKPVSKRVFGMLEGWLAAGAASREYIALELQDSEVFNASPHSLMKVLGGEAGSTAHAKKHANLVFMGFPGGWGLERTDELLGLVKELCTEFPFRSGHAGFCFLCSRYEEGLSQTHAWEKSMRHRGIDIFDAVNDIIAAGQDGLKGVGWLTMLGESLVEELGGGEKIGKDVSKPVEVLRVGNGVLLKAGPRPEIGDTNRRDDLPAYKQVYRAVAPLVERAVSRSKSLNLDGSDYKERTLDWLRRFSDG